MQKLIALVTRPPGAERDVKLGYQLHEAAMAVLSRIAGVAGLTVNLVDEEELGLAADPPIDAVLELWLEDGSLDPTALISAQTSVAAFTVHLYHVAEHVQLDHARTWALGERSPGVKVVYVTRRPDGLDAREAARRWREHAPLARRHHSGMSRYVQNGVIDALTPDAPIVHGFAVLHFPTRADLEQRMYDSAEGQRAIAADAARLVTEALPLYTSEYILRESTAPRDASRP